MLTSDNLTVEFSGTTLFSNISFVINEKDRIATAINGTEYIYSPALPANLHAKFFITTFDAFNNESEAARVEIIY